MHYLSILYGKNYDCKLFTLQDTSLYDGVSPLQNIVLEVRPPGSECFIPFTLINGWCSKTFNCFDLNICCINDCISVLPDGVYEFKYSIDPNIETLIEVQHLRICQLMKNYIKTIGIFLSKRCTYSHKENKEIEKFLIFTKYLIDAAIYEVEENFNTNGGLELYNEALKNINSLNDGSFKCAC